jgi:hypothetical protein
MQQHIHSPPPQLQQQQEHASYQPLYTPFQRQLHINNFSSLHSPQISTPDKGKTIDHQPSPDTAFDAAFAAFDDKIVTPEVTNEASAYTSRTSLEIEARGLSDDNSTRADIDQRIAELHNDYRDERDFEVGAPQLHYPHPGDMDVVIEDTRELTALQNPLPEILSQEQQPQLTPEEIQKNHDELAATAGLLLQGVKHDMSEKFQKSEFLGFMRQLRDGEIRVEDNQVVTVGPQRVWSKEEGKWILPHRHTGAASDDPRPYQDWGEDGETIPVNSQEEAAERRQEATRRFQARRAAKDAERLRNGQPIESYPGERIRSGRMADGTREAQVLESV